MITTIIPTLPGSTGSTVQIPPKVILMIPIPAIRYMAVPGAASPLSTFTWVMASGITGVLRPLLASVGAILIMAGVMTGVGDIPIPVGTVHGTAPGTIPGIILITTRVTTVVAVATRGTMKIIRPIMPMTTTTAQEETLPVLTRASLRGTTGLLRQAITP